MAYKIPASSVIANQFPGFVVEDYPKFTRFVELYYTFLKETELSGVGNISTIRDIDSTLDKFVDSLWGEFGIDSPKTNVKDDKFFLKHIKDFYSSKGSEESFRILFRHLFNTEIEIKYPKDYIFKSSDGEWVQDNSFLVDVTAGDVFHIVGQQVYVSTSKQVVPISVNRVRPIDNLYEVFFDRTDISVFSPGDIITFDGVHGTLTKTISGTSIYKSGTGFFLGQVFTLPSVIGADAKIKVTKIGVGGELLGVELVNFGYGYNYDFYASILSTSTADSALGVFPIVDSKTIGFIDSGYVSKNDYYDSGYCSPVYVGEKLSIFFTDVTTQGNSLIDDAHTAILNIKIGAVRKYPGFYKNDKGFLSNVYKLQDNYYQIYSYVISTLRNINEYRNIVKALIHPTGMKLFGEQKLSNEILLISSVEILNRYFQLSVHEIVTLQDSLACSVTKVLSDNSNATDFYSLMLDKSLEDTFSASDSGSVVTNPYCDVTYIDNAYSGIVLGTF